jgi:hypothetical protein
MLSMHWQQLGCLAIEWQPRPPSGRQPTLCRGCLYAMDDVCEDFFSEGRGSSRQREGSVVMRAIDDDMKCYFCEVGMGDCQPTDVTSASGASKVAHRSCYNGHHALQRIIDKLAEDNPELDAHANPASGRPGALQGDGALPSVHAARAQWAAARGSQILRRRNDAADSLGQEGESTLADLQPVLGVVRR